VVNAALVTGLTRPGGIAILGSNIIFTNESAGTIAEYTTSGVLVNAALVTGLNSPIGVAVIFQTNITASSGDYVSDVGQTLFPVFDGGTLTTKSNTTDSNTYTVTGNGGTIDGAGYTLTFAGTIADAVPGTPGHLTIANSGTGGWVVLTGANTYSGGTTILTGANAMAGNNAAFGTGRVDMAQGSTLGFAVSGLTLNNPFTVSGDPTFTTVAGGTDTIAGAIADGSSPGTVEVAGSGTLVLSGVNSYTGGTNIAPGATLQIGTGGAIGPGAVNNAGNLVLSTPQTIVGNYTQTGTLTINASNANGGRMITAGSANMPNAQVVFNGQNGFVPAPGSNYVLVVANASGTSYAGDRLTA